MEQFTEGFFLQASLILALGAQNLYVLDAGLNRRKHLLVATICTICDVLLILLGVLGAASVLVQIPWLKILFGFAGVAFLAYYGLKKLFEKASMGGEQLHLSVPTLGLVVSQTLAFSLLNPHVYLDTVVLIGGYSTQFPSWIDRVEFGAGASLFSMIWFFSLALFAAAMGRFLHNPSAMRVISVVSGVILLALSVKLGIDVWHWL